MGLSFSRAGARRGRLTWVDGENPAGCPSSVAGIPPRLGRCCHRRAVVAPSGAAPQQTSRTQQPSLDVISLSGLMLGPEQGVRWLLARLLLDRLPAVGA